MGRSLAHACAEDRHALEAFRLMVLRHTQMYRALAHPIARLNFLDATHWLIQVLIRQSNARLSLNDSLF
jgi:hypothetical protein